MIYSDRPAGPPQQTYSDRGNADNRIPAPGFIDPNEDIRVLRPPEAIGAPGNVTGSVQPPVPLGADGKPMVLSALPPDEQPEVAPAQLAPNLRRQEVAFATKEPAGTLIVDTPNTYLYYVLGGGRAIRYGVRVGRDGFTWTGVQKISRKAEWPDWHPPTEMIERQPYLPRFMAGGPGNPLGARAMYLGSTVYRIHGTNQPSTIGKFVSSGCIGMLNEDVSDLFDRVKVGTRVVVLPGGAPPVSTTTASAQPVPGPNAGPPLAPVERCRNAADRGAAAARAGDGALKAGVKRLHRATSTTVRAVEHGQAGNIYRIVDDDPAQVREWLTALAAMLGAKPPFHVPALIARMVAGASRALRRAVAAARPSTMRRCPRPSGCSGCESLPR